MKGSLLALQMLALQRLSMIGADSKPVKNRIGKRKRKKRNAVPKNKTSYKRRIVIKSPPPAAPVEPDTVFNYGSLQSLEGAPVLNDDGKKVGVIGSALGAGKTHAMDIEQAKHIARVDLQNMRKMNERGEAVYLVGGGNGRYA